MSANDPVAVILGGLDRPVEPRPAFAEALLARLLDELAGAPAPARAQLPRFRLPRILPGAPPRLRLALIVIVILLLLAGVALATYFGVRTWVSAGPRGVQYTSDFRLSLVFRHQPRRWDFWPQFMLGPGERDVFALVQPPPYPNPQHRTELVRIPGIATTQSPVKATHVLSFNDLAKPGLWDPGIDLSRAVIGEFVSGSVSGEGSPSQSLAVAGNGDLFLVAGVWPKTRQRKLPRTSPPLGSGAVRTPPLDVSVIVRHRDGSTEKVLTFRDLARAGRFRDDPGLAALWIAASAPNRLWIKAQVFQPPVVTKTSYAQFGAFSFYEVIDPNADGHWRDRIIRRIKVPESLPVAVKTNGYNPWIFPQLVTERSVGEVDRSRSVLVSADNPHSGDFRVYRLSDDNDDGDALDRGELERIFSRRIEGVDRPPPEIAARVVVERGKVVLREIVATGLTLPTRLSRISASGRVIDFGRAFEFPQGILAGTDGRIYAVVQVPGSGSTPPGVEIYRFEPAGTRSAAVSPGKARTTSSTPPATRPRLPLLAFTIESTDGEKGRIMLIGADGRGLRPLVQGVHNHGFCQSADGRKMAFFSDQEAPHEPFLYLANADATNARKITEKQVGFLCGFSERWLIVTVARGSVVTLVRRDLRTGTETQIATNIERLQLSPNGNELVFVGGLVFSGGIPPSGKETLELLSLDTLTLRRLDGPLPKRSYGGWGQDRFGLQWSPDGTRVAYVVGPWAYPSPGQILGNTTPPAHRELTVRNIQTGAPLLRLPLYGGPPSLAWSPDGNSLLVCLPTQGALELGCDGGEPHATESARLMLVNIRDRRSHTIASGRLLWAGWSPTGGYAYANEHAAFLATSPSASIHKLANAARLGWPAGSWLGWSPDGRYIGLGDSSLRLAVLDVATGRVRVLIRQGKRELFDYRKWWR